MIEKRKILIQIADPAGNTTAYVLSGARREEYEGIARFIMEKMDLGVEQVAFVKGTDSFDMSGMEFCGNATRAFALMSAKGMIDGNSADDEIVNMEITVSDGEKPVSCTVWPEKDYTKISMPLPKRVKTLKHCDFKPAENHDVIVMDGIIHIILDGETYSEESFEMVRDAIITQFDPQALGVMYLDSDTLEMTPVVYVKEVNSTYVEGSCGSGTTAAAYYLSNGRDDGEYSYEIRQPKGSIVVKAKVSGGTPEEITIEGPVNISDPEFIEAEYEVEDKGDEFDF